MIDAEKLLAWLESKAGAKSPLAGAIYQGLAARVRRGEFDAHDERPGAIAHFMAEGLTAREAANAFEGFPLDHNAATPCNCGHCHLTGDE